MTEEKKGEVFILSEAVLWSLFPVVTLLSIRNTSPVLSLAWSTLFAAVFFAASLTVRRKWNGIFRREALQDILLTTLFNGIIYYLLFFIGMRHTSAGNAGLIACTEIFFSFITFQVLRKEHIPVSHIWGAALMSLGAVIVLCPNVSRFHAGDLLILSAACIAPWGNHFQRRARRKVNSESILFIRCLISAPVLFLTAHLIGADSGSTGLSGSMVYFMLNGFFLLGFSKYLWVEGIHRVSITKASALSGLAPLLTLLFAWLLLHNVPTRFQLLSFVPMFAGIVLLGRNEAPAAVERPEATEREVLD